ncbi:MAG TPA: TIGR02996 domain-containing protein [Kofleriaceae bacterium]|nr:TIGR02996 domain-containing protein [Kofleriaceae bacterium]
MAEDPRLRATLEAALEAAIDAAPDDDRGYEVYADHLQELGDVRGELIALSLAANRDAAADDATRTRRQALEAKLAPPGRGTVPGDMASSRAPSSRRRTRRRGSRIRRCGSCASSRCRASRT